MTMQVKRTGGIRIIELKGDIAVGKGMARPLDLQGKQVPDLQSTLQGLIERGDKQILLDLSQVNFIDSAGFGELIAAKNRTVEEGGDIKLLMPTEKIHKLLASLMLTEVFEVFGDEQEAVGSFIRKGN